MTGIKYNKSNQALWSVLQGCLDLQLYWISHLQNSLKCEHNQQVMCEAGLPQQILDRCEAALVTEDHPLHAPLQRMFERLASQSLTPTVLRYLHAKYSLTIFASYTVANLLLSFVLKISIMFDEFFVLTGIFSGLDHHFTANPLKLQRKM